MNTICGICGKEFVPVRVDNRYCSTACRRKSYRLEEEIHRPREPLETAPDTAITDFSFREGTNYKALKEALARKKERKICETCVWGFGGVCIMPACQKRL